MGGLGGPAHLLLTLALWSPAVAPLLAGRLGADSAALRLLLAAALAGAAVTVVSRLIAAYRPKAETAPRRREADWIIDADDVDGEPQQPG